MNRKWKSFKKKIQKEMYTNSYDFNSNNNMYFILPVASRHTTIG